MPEYEIVFECVGDHQIVVEADSKDEAVDKAWREFNKCPPQHEWDVIDVVDIDEEGEEE